MMIPLGEAGQPVRHAHPSEEMGSPRHAFPSPLPQAQVLGSRCCGCSWMSGGNKMTLLSRPNLDLGEQPREKKRSNGKNRSMLPPSRSLPVTPGIRHHFASWTNVRRDTLLAQQETEDPLTALVPQSPPLGPLIHLMCPPEPNSPLLEHSGYQIPNFPPQTSKCTSRARMG